MENVFPAGTVILFTQGCYSDYGLCGEVVTLKVCNLPELVLAYKATLALKIDRSREDPSDFVAWLVMHGWAAPLESSTVHLGDYGRVQDL